MPKHFQPYATFDAALLGFQLGTDRQGKPAVHMAYNNSDVALVSAPAVTMWPRVTGDGNFGTMWGPTDPTKAKFTLDLTDAPITNGAINTEFEAFAALLEQVDDALLDFVTANQLRVLGRKNLSRDEVKMLQIRSVKPKFDKLSGQLNGNAVQLSVSKFAWDGCGGKYVRKVTICDHAGNAIPNGAVCPGDCVAATMYANQVYTGVGGDKFGIHWAFQDVAVVCQRENLDTKTTVDAFGGQDWAFAKPYQDQVSELNASYATEVGAA